MSEISSQKVVRTNSNSDNEAGSETNQTAMKSNSNSLQPEVKKVNVPKNNEISFELDEDGSLYVSVVRGAGEIFGSVLIKHQKYYYEGRKYFAIYTQRGCLVEMKGNNYEYKVRENMYMRTYIHLNHQLNVFSHQASDGDIHGPKVLVVGPTDAGKTSLCKVLLNYAARIGKTSSFIDLDVGQNSIGIPGTMSMVHVDKMLDPVADFNFCNSTYSLHYGLVSPQRQSLYLKNINQLAKVFESACQREDAIKYSGCFINTCGWVKDFGFEAIKCAAIAFECQHVIVVGCEETKNKLQEILPRSSCEVILIPKNTGAVQRCTSFRRTSRALKVAQYFKGAYGVKKTYDSTYTFDTVKLLQYGKTYGNQECESLQPVQMGEHLKGKIVSALGQDYSADVLNENIRAFATVKSVDLESKKVVLSSPHFKLSDYNSFVLMEYDLDSSN